MLEIYEKIFHAGPLLGTEKPVQKITIFEVEIYSSYFGVKKTIFIFLVKSTSCNVYHWI